MTITCYINNTEQKADSNDTILSVLNKIGISIPTLCNMKEFSPTGACRLCVVEDAETGELITSCSTPVRENMKIFTHSPEVISARKTIVELLLANHPENCLYCDKSGNCELQKLSEDLNIREKVFYGDLISGKTDRSSPGIVRDMSKCILCGRCVRICDEILGVSAIDLISRGKNTSIETVFQKGLFYSDCIHCGLCVTACPTGAIIPKSGINQLIEKLGNDKTTKSIMLPATTIANIAVTYNIRKYEDARNMLVAALHTTGFNKVYTMSLFNDFFISEATSIIQTRLKKSNKTLIITDCPAITKYIQIKEPELVDFLCKIPPPQQIGAKILSTQEPTDILVSVSPCIAHKYEAVQTQNTNKGVPEIDFVLTSDELDKLLRTLGITLPFSRKETPDNPTNSDSSAGVFFDTKHGIAEGIVRELFYRLELTNQLNRIIEIKPEKDFLEYEFQINKTYYSVACISGIENLVKYKKQILDGNYLFVEVRSCKSGCIDGCGQKLTDNQEKQKRLRKIISEYDEKTNNNTPGKNPFIKGFYKNNQLKNIF
ncbi:MAG: [Fe-Fe] hydrogenase large subunit C-terminal domain-containing protein [Bacteroidales bacterium]|nr:[Fe-Fe] hydrogenase large subunit C-terminal domain-containing protein [Bacteroidales bacterium]